MGTEDLRLKVAKFMKTTQHPYLSAAAERAASWSDRKRHRLGRRLLRTQVPGEQAFRWRTPGSPLQPLVLTSLLTRPGCGNQRLVQKTPGARIRVGTSASAQKKQSCLVS